VGPPSQYPSDPTIGFFVSPILLFASFAPRWKKCEPENYPFFGPGAFNSGIIDFFFFSDLLQPFLLKEAFDGVFS